MSKFIKTTGSRAEVMHGTAKHTSGNLLKKDLMKNKYGRIVSRSKHLSAKKQNNLVKHGYGTKKGKFGFVKIGSKSQKRGRKSCKKRGPGRPKKSQKRGRKCKTRGGSLSTGARFAAVDDPYTLSGGMVSLSPADLNGGMVSLSPADLNGGEGTTTGAQGAQAVLLGGRKRKGSRKGTKGGKGKKGRKGTKSHKGGKGKRSRKH
jgi:hypothetical protein